MCEIVFAVVTAYIKKNTQKRQKKNLCFMNKIAEIRLFYFYTTYMTTKYVRQLHFL